MPVHVGLDDAEPPILVCGPRKTDHAVTIHAVCTHIYIHTHTHTMGRVIGAGLGVLYTHTMGHVIGAGLGVLYTHTHTHTMGHVIVAGLGVRCLQKPRPAALHMGVPCVTPCLLAHCHDIAHTPKFPFFMHSLMRKGKTRLLLCHQHQVTPAQHVSLPPCGTLPSHAPTLYPGLLQPLQVLVWRLPAREVALAAVIALPLSM